MFNKISGQFLLAASLLMLSWTKLWAQQDKKVLRVMSYNMRIASPPSTNWGGTDLPAIAKVINDNKPDLVALQEVDAFTERSGKTSHQAKELAEMTGMHYFFAKAIDRSGGDYGVAVLSRFPIIKSEGFRLPVSSGSDGEIRGLALIVVEAFGNEIAFASAHLDHKSDDDRKLQVENVIRIAKKYKNLPIIFSADLNMTPDNPVMNLVRKNFFLPCSTCPLTFPQDNPRSTIDYILLNKKAEKQFRTVNYGTVDEKYASDHLPLIAEFRF